MASISTQVVLSSSWTVSGDLHSVLFIRDSVTEVLLSEPLLSESTLSPLLLDCCNEEPCYVHIDLTGLRKYRPSSIELISGSRTVEVYDRQRDEYLSTVRGALVKTPGDSSNGTKLYSCVLELLSDSSLNNVSIKLLSLKEKEHVCISRLLLDLSENCGGGLREETHSKPLSDHHQMLSSFASLNLPPFLQCLVSSLQSASSSRDKDDATDQPKPDLGGMSLALRQIHDTLSLPTVSEPPPSTEGSLEEPENKELIDETLSLEQQELLLKLEEKLKTYIDAKFVELEQKFENQLEKLFTERVKGLSLSQSNQGTNGSSELVEDLDQLD